MPGAHGAKLPSKFIAILAIYSLEKSSGLPGKVGGMCGRLRGKGFMVLSVSSAVPLFIGIRVANYRNA